MDRICPIMAQGWLQNRYAVVDNRKYKNGLPTKPFDSEEVGKSFKAKRLPKCLEGECALFNGGGCGLATDPAPKVAIVNNAEGGG